MKKYEIGQLNKMSQSQLVGIVLSMQKDLKHYDDVVASVTDYRLGLVQLHKHIEKVLERTKNLKRIKPGMII